jgi:hypothetical protein
MRTGTITQQLAQDLAHRKFVGHAAGIDFHHILHALPDVAAWARLQNDHELESVTQHFGTLLDRAIQRLMPQ